MSDFQKSGFDLVARPAVASQRKQFGSVTLESLPGTTVLQILASTADDRAGVLARLQGNYAADLRMTAPGQWLLVREEAPDPAAIDAVATRLAGLAYVVDQSHGRARFRVSGADIRRVLAKGTGIDLHADAFGIGQSAMTLIGHIGVNLARVGQDDFELLVLRGFAEDLWHELETMSAEFA